MNNVKEEYLQFIWKHGLFCKITMTSDGRQLLIIDRGTYNHHSGPDFTDAHIRIDNIDLFGSIEIHCKSSDWYKHKHDNDNTYKNVILHVVFYNDKQVNMYGAQIPILVIANAINTSILNNIGYLMTHTSDITCKKFFNIDIHYDKLVKDRFEKKTLYVLSLLNSNCGSWEDTAFQVLLYNFGFGVNNKEMLQLATSVKYCVVKKNSYKIDSLRALLLGQAGLLGRVSAENTDKLHNEYNFLRTKYQLQPTPINWHFSKLRPNNFPTARIIQISDMLHTEQNIFDMILTGSRKSLHDVFHKVKPSLSSSTIDCLMINMVIPMQMAYEREHFGKDGSEILSKLGNIAYEENHITKKFGPASTANAYFSQALIELYKTYCSHSMCLQCPTKFIEK